MSSQDFKFYNPAKIVSGSQALDSLGYELGQLRAQRILMITDRGVLEAGLIDRVNKSLEKSDNRLSVFHNKVILVLLTAEDGESKFFIECFG